MPAGLEPRQDVQTNRAMPPFSIKLLDFYNSTMKTEEGFATVSSEWGGSGGWAVGCVFPCKACAAGRAGLAGWRGARALQYVQPGWPGRASGHCVPLPPAQAAGAFSRCIAACPALLLLRFEPACTRCRSPARLGGHAGLPRQGGADPPGGGRGIAMRPCPLGASGPAAGMLAAARPLLRTPRPTTCFGTHPSPRPLPQAHPKSAPVCGCRVPLSSPSWSSRATSPPATT